MPLNVHVSGMSNSLGITVMQQCAVSGVPYGYAVGSTINGMLLMIQPPKNMKVDIVGDGDDLDVKVHPV